MSRVNDDDDDDNYSINFFSFIFLLSIELVQTFSPSTLHVFVPSLSGYVAPVESCTNYLMA